MARTPHLYSGRYEIVRQIARGGMAEVYLARDQLLDRRVALKMLFPELSTDPSFVERFRREAQAAANLSHPNIVSVYDWGEEGGTYFIVMEFVDGMTLSEVIRNEGRLLPDRAADIGAEVAGALAFAHRNGVVHRDVKPGNVLIDSEDRVKVADFGIARAAASANENLTQTGAVMGTATYFSPEQAQGATVDARSDVYSLGVVLYEMVTGRPPFTGDNPVTVAYKHVREQAVPPRQANPALPAAFEAIVLQAMAKDPNQRYASADELRADLLRFRQGRQVAAVPPPLPTQAVAAQTQAVRAGGPATMVGGAVVEAAPARRTGAYVALLFLMLAALAALLFLLAREFGVGGSGKDNNAATIAVPAVEGKPVADAEKILQDQGFTSERAYEHNAADKDIVFAQDPKAGENAPKGSKITLRVSQGEETVRVPRVTGLKQQEAEDELTGQGFKVGNVQPQPSDTVAAGIVLSQDPASGQQAPKGTAVNLTVSSGKEQVTIPNEAGKDSAVATNDLGKLGLGATTKQESSSSVPNGKVIRTDPAAGQSVDKGSTVTVIVSSGPAMVNVPDVQGMTEAQATKTLEDAGFKVQSKDQTTTSDADDGRVVDQNPDAGTKAEQGSTVTIFVGKKTTATTL
ncbi:MAG: eukaryotic-like serine/threonine-protein kinase [Acidimicrobiaceae bacterium]|nr:eukaryotic-like serine/threonine-protein kinase [Acidimicrobiaceae bacterium]